MLITLCRVRCLWVKSDKHRPALCTCLVFMKNWILLHTLCVDLYSIRPSICLHVIFMVNIQLTISLHANILLDAVTCIGLPEHSDLIKRIEQEVPQYKKFSKGQIHLSSVVGQGIYVCTD